MGAPGATSAWRAAPAKGPMVADIKPASRARVPAGLRAAIDKALSTEPVISPAGVTLSWGPDGAVWFSRSKGPAGQFELSPQSMGRSRPRMLSPGPFVFGPRRTTEALGDGLTAWYATVPSGFEQGFTVSQPPAGRAGSFSINMFYSSSLDPAIVAPGRLGFSGPAGPVLAYGPLQATDASGRVVPTQLSLTDDGDVQMVVHDAGATYPLDIDSRITASRTPVASFSGSSGASFGESVALSADGREALVGAQFANPSWRRLPICGDRRNLAHHPGGDLHGQFGRGPRLLGGAVGRRPGGPGGHPVRQLQREGAAYVYEESAGRWPTSPVATLSGSPGEALGNSVALSADGQEALVGAPAAGTWRRRLPLSPVGRFLAGHPHSQLPGQLRDEGLGSSVALSADGRVALVGAQFAGSAIAPLTFTLSRRVLGPPPLRRASSVLRARLSALRWRCRPTAGWRWWAPRSPAG